MDDPLSAFEGIAPALAMIAAFACLFGGAGLVLRRQDVRKGVLMIVLAAVLIGNVVIWSM